MTTMNRGKEKRQTTAETSFIEGETHSRVITSSERVWDSLTGIFPEAKATEIEASYSKRGRLQVKMSGHGKKAYDLYTEERGTNKQRLSPKLPNQIKTALGTEREVLIAQKDKEIEKLHKSIGDEIIANDENVDIYT